MSKTYRNTDNNNVKQSRKESKRKRTQRKHRGDQ